MKAGVAPLTITLDDPLGIFCFWCLELWALRIGVFIARGVMFLSGHGVRVSLNYRLYCGKSTLDFFVPQDQQTGSKRGLLAGIVGSDQQRVCYMLAGGTACRIQMI